MPERGTKPQGGPVDEPRSEQLNRTQTTGLGLAGRQKAMQRPAHAGGPPPPEGAQSPDVESLAAFQDGPPGHIKRFFVENDNLGDDWCAFPTQKEAEDFIREKCGEIADANLDEGGLGQAGTRFMGMDRNAIVEELFQENVDCIEERWVKSTGHAVEVAPEVHEAFIVPPEDMGPWAPVPDPEQFTSLQEKFQLATKVHAEAVAKAVEDGIRSIRGLVVEGHLNLVEMPDDADGYRFRFEGLVATFPGKEFPQNVPGDHAWEVSVTASFNLNSISVQVWNEAESIPKELEEWDGSYKPFEVGKEATEFVESLPRARDEELRHRQRNGF